MATSTVMYLVFLLSLTYNVFAEPAMNIEVLKPAPKDCTSKAQNGDEVTMHYVGKLLNGKQFDSSYSRSQPFSFKLGLGNVIQGWEQSIPGMCVGEKRRLTVPPSLAYGDRGFGDIIPAKSTLVFEIELMALNSDASPSSDKAEQKETEQKETEQKETEQEETEQKETEQKETEQKETEQSEEEYVEDGHQHPDSFESLDTNGDKQISSEEMTNYIKKFQETEDAEVGEDSIETIVSEIFQHDDKNKDGFISLEEYQHFAANQEVGDGEEDGQQGEEGEDNISEEEEAEPRGGAEEFEEEEPKKDEL